MYVGALRRPIAVGGSEDDVEKRRRANNNIIVLWAWRALS
jgi:hypothetical protein